ncbi:hypothetical protein OHQ88_34285 (plasmid) [Micromonospora zamorensis]|uniref:hypothetical protein n=1 Tax=Micromonospora zamorensis TaxID=709883 RepID=UPI002E1EA1F8
MDYGRVENSWPIPGSGGRELELISAADEDLVARKELMMLFVVKRGSPLRIVEHFSTYRNGPGWKQLRAGIAGGDAHMAAAHQWWTQHRDSPLVRGYHMLAALEVQLQQSPDRPLTDILGVRAAEVSPGGQYSAVVDALMDLRLLGLRSQGRFGVTKQGDAVLRPTKAAMLEWFGSAMTAALQQAESTEARSRPGQAFAPLKVAPTVSRPTSTVHSPTAGPARRSAGR